MKYGGLIRKLPAINVAAAVVDLIVRVLVFLSLWHADKFMMSASSNSDLSSQVFFGTAERLIGVVLYPLGWLTSAAVLYVLILIYDRGQAHNA